jgi:hypothetical protein
MKEALSVVFRTMKVRFEIDTLGEDVFAISHLLSTDIIFEVKAFSYIVISVRVKYSSSITVEIDAMKGKVVTVRVMYDVISTMNEAAGNEVWLIFRKFLSIKNWWWPYLVTWDAVTAERMAANTRIRRMSFIMILMRRSNFDEKE